MAEENLLRTTIFDATEQVITATESSVAINTLPEVEAHSVFFNKPLNSVEEEILRIPLEFSFHQQKLVYKVEKIRYPYFDKDNLHWNHNYYEAPDNSTIRLYIENITLATDPVSMDQEVRIILYKYSGGIVTEVAPNELNTNQPQLSLPDAEIPVRYLAYVPSLTYDAILLAGDRLYLTITKTSGIDPNIDVILMDNSITLIVEQDI